jgi:uncharacterized protein YecT (DUF1311 family)
MNPRVAPALILTLLAAGCGQKNLGRSVDHPAAMAAAPDAAGLEASFDCARASSAFEKSVCADPALAKADRDLAATWRLSYADTPPEWRPRMLASQRSWLGFVASTCLKGDLPRMAGGETIASCRRKMFEERIATLKASFTNAAGRRFIAFTTYHTQRDADPVDGVRSSPSAITLRQIMRPADASERRWNAAVDKAFTGFAGGADPSADASVEIENWAPGYLEALLRRADPRGPGGDSFRFRTVHWSLRLNRELNATDIFGDPAVAKLAISHLALADIRKEIDPDQREAVNDLSEEDYGSAIVAKDGYWSFGPKGLEIGPDDDNAYGGAHFAAASLAATVSWSELKPYLRHDLPFDLKTLRSAQ